MKIHGLLEVLRDPLRRPGSAPVDWQVLADGRPAHSGIAAFLEYFADRVQSLRIGGPSAGVGAYAQMLLSLECFLSQGVNAPQLFLALGSPVGVPEDARARLVGTSDRRILLGNEPGKAIVTQITVEPAGSDPVLGIAGETPGIAPRLGQVAAWSIHIDRLGVPIRQLTGLVERLQSLDATILVIGDFHNMVPLILRLERRKERFYSVATSHEGHVLLAIR